MKKIFDFEHPFFQPLWRRITLVVFLGGWSIFEYTRGYQIWAIVFGTICVACINGLLLRYNKPPTKNNGGPNDET